MDRRIKNTKNYRLFERSEFNRPTDRRPRLHASMKKYGYLPCFPIVCELDKNGKLIVKDGQHRLAIAESLGLDVYYVVDDTEFFVADAAAGQRPWSIRDYAITYSNQGNKHYTEAIEFADKYKVPLGAACAMLAGTVNWSNIEPEYKVGKFVIKDRQWAEAVASIYVPIAKACPATRNARLLEACMSVCRVKEFDPERLIRNIARCREKLVAYSTRDAYLEMLEDIYNFGRMKLVPLKIESLNAMKTRNVAYVTKKSAGKNNGKVSQC